MKSYICTECGGKINLERMICEYCGTIFQEEQNEMIRAVRYNPNQRAHLLDAHIIISKEFLAQLPKEESEYIVRSKLAQELVERISQLIVVNTTELPTRNEIILTTRLRMLDSEYRF